jgi:hypothetical protein
MASHHTKTTFINDLKCMSNCQQFSREEMLQHFDMSKGYFDRLFTCHVTKSFHYFFFFFLPFPFHLTGLSGTFYGRLGFLFSFVVRRGSGVLSPATYAHPLSSPFSGRHNRNITTHNIHGRPSGLGFEPC